MPSLYDHLSLREIEERIVFHENEIKRLNKEKVIRIKEKNYHGNLWEPLDVLMKKNIPNFVLPTEVEHPSKKEEKRLTKEGNHDVKNLILKIRSNMKNEIANKGLSDTETGNVDPNVLRFLSSGSSKNNKVEKNNENKVQIQNNIEEEKNSDSDDEETQISENIDEFSSEINVKEINNIKEVNLPNQILNNSKKRVVRKKEVKERKQKTYEELNPEINDLWKK